MWSNTPTELSSEGNEATLNHDIRGPNFCGSSALSRLSSLRQRAAVVVHILATHRMIPFFCLLLFGVLVGSTVAILYVVRDSERRVMEDEAHALALETGRWFSDQLASAIHPLFSLAQFAIELDVFLDLPTRIGPGNESGSVPYVQDPVITHRNVTGVCDDPTVIGRYNEIAATLKRNAQMEGVLITLELAPHGVVCLAYPLNNTEDFPEGIFYDVSGAIGQDLLVDPLRKDAAEATLVSNKPVVVGPLKLRACKDCHPSVEQGFIVRVPIVDSDHVINIQGISYLRWGFAVAIINWKELVTRSKMYEKFRAAHFEFILTQDVLDWNPETNAYDKQVVALAETDGFASIRETPGGSVVSTKLDTSYNDWIMSVGYIEDQTKFLAILCASIVVSLAVSCLVFAMMIQSQLHSLALNATSAELVEQARLAAKRERELNEYIAHEVRNPLAAAISACNFVSASVGEKEPLADEASRVAVREDVGIIEISLQFVNDLLRSMLDLSRASNHQLELDFVPVDVAQDILQPVAAMLYSRDHLFDVIVDCPSNLIVKADRLRLKQVVVNLGRNATKFVEEGFVRLCASVVDGLVRIYIEDSGPGIPENKRTNLFCKFQESLDVLSQGTGIGLSLCEHLVSLMGGSVYLDESYDSGILNNPGARFVIDLNTPPVSSHGDDVQDLFTPEATPLTIDDARAVKLFPETLSVLFVDDDMLLRRLFRRSISKVFPNWSISEASSGEAALSLVATHIFDVIFIDQYMTSTEKNLLGTETVRLMRTNGCYAKICGLSANDIEKPFKTAGANAFVIKPFPCKEDAMRSTLWSILYGEVVEAHSTTAIPETGLPLV